MFKFSYFIIVLVAVYSLAAPFFVYAAVNEDISRQMQEAGAASGQTSRDPRYIVADIIKVLLSLIGTIFLGLTVYAGYLWMTAGGNSDQADKAKTLLYQAVIGLLIALSAYAITIFVVKFALGDYEKGFFTSDADWFN